MSGQGSRPHAGWRVSDNMAHPKDRERMANEAQEHIQAGPRRIPATTSHVGNEGKGSVLREGEPRLAKLAVTIG